MNTIQYLCFIKKYDDILLDILRWKVYENYVSIDLHVAKLIQEMVNNILTLGPLHIATESRPTSVGLIFGSGSTRLSASQAGHEKNGIGILIYPFTANTATNRRQSCRT